jgi:hypothetical protein
MVCDYFVFEGYEIKSRVVVRGVAWLKNNILGEYILFYSRLGELKFLTLHVEQVCCGILS